MQPPSQQFGHSSLISAPQDGGAPGLPSPSQEAIAASDRAALERTAAATELHELLTDLGNPISELGLTMELRDFVVMVRFKTITLRCFGSQRGWTIRVLVEGAGQIAICELRSLRRTVWAIRAFGEFVSEEPEAVVRLARRIAWYSILLPH